MTTSPPSRAIYGHSDLRRVLSPHSVAVVGASPRIGSFSNLTIQELTTFVGDVWLVNPKYDSISDRKVYPSLTALPQIPDCVVITAGRDAVEKVVLECATLGVGGVVVYASGFAETGHPEWVQLQARLAKIGRETGLRILGPNCMGFANFALDLILSFVSYTRCGRPREDAIGIATQSGAMSNSLVQAGELGVSFSHTLSAGNSCDVDVADLVAYLAEEPSCKAIACVIEGLTQPARFMEAADLAWRNGKPLVVYKMATGAAGARAAASHTGMLAGSNETYSAAFDRHGVIVVDRLEDVIETASFFAKSPRLAPQQGTAVLSTSGAAAIMSADAGEAHGVPLPQPADANRELLARLIPEFGSSNNPFDVTAQLVASIDALQECAEAVLSDPAYGAIVLAQPQAYEAAVPRIDMVGKIAARHGKAACNVLVSQWLNGPGAVEAQAHPNVALFRSMDRCFATLRAWHDRSRRLREEQSRPEQVRNADPTAAQRVAGLLEAGAASGLLTERAGKQVLSAYGIPTVPEALVESGSAAADAARRFGYPVVLKVESPAIAHKTEAGVVALNIQDEVQLLKAYEHIIANARRAITPDRVLGVLVQPMLPKGVEIMLGAKVDPQFGPLIVVGLGGIFVELLHDAASALAPVSHAKALEMLQKLKAGALLDGFRGGPVVDRNKLAEMVCRASEMMSDLARHVNEVDINPLICNGSEIVAVDALFVLARSPELSQAAVALDPSFP